MLLRIAASVMNVLMMMLSVALLVWGVSLLFIAGIAAGIYNLYMLWKGMDYKAETANVLGIFANMLAAICGLIILIQGISLGDQGRNEPLTLVIGGVFILCGFVTMVVSANQSFEAVQPTPVPPDD